MDAAEAAIAARTPGVCRGVGDELAAAHSPHLAATPHYRLWHDGRLTRHGFGEAGGPIVAAPSIPDCMFPMAVVVATPTKSHASYIIIDGIKARRCRRLLEYFVAHEGLYPAQRVPV